MFVAEKEAVKLSSETHVASTDRLMNMFKSVQNSLADSRGDSVRKEEEELQTSPEAQERFVKFLPRLYHRAIHDHSFLSHFNTLVEEEVSLFNTYYLKQLCTI